MATLLSDQTLPAHCQRVLTPEFLLLKLPHHPLTRQLYAVGIGHYQQLHEQHWHDPDPRHYLVLYCTAGQGRVRLDAPNVASVHEQDKVVRPGTLLVLPPEQGYWLLADTDWSLYWIVYDGELAANFTERLLMKMPQGLADIGHQPRAIADVETLLDLPVRGYTATNVIHAVHLLQQLLSFLALQLRLNQTPEQTELDLEVLEALMMERLHGSLDLATLAARAHLSKFYFSKKFRELTQHSPIQYFLNMKMQHACHLLQHRSHSVKQIAADLGYDDPYYFSRLFKKIVGQSPVQYRQQHQAQRCDQGLAD
jgi:AraC-like DNA-binding protein